MNFVNLIGALCAGEEDVDYDDGEVHLQPLVSVTESETSFDDQANTLHADYKDVTPLFRAIELEDWKSILVFLTTGRWNSSILSSTYSHLEDPSAQRQARTWITCSDKSGGTQWRQLPLHAAISYLAPLPVIQKILDLHHDAIRSADDTGNLPLHLAFGFGSPDPVVAYLIKEYPQALYVKGLQNRRPLDCCDLGPNKARGEVVKAFQQHTTEKLMKNWDKHWKKSLVDAKKQAGISEPFLSKCKTLEDVFNELMQAKIELKKAQELAKNRPTMIITKTAPAPAPAPAPAFAKSSRSPSTGTTSYFPSLKKKGSNKSLKSLRSRAGKKAASFRRPSLMMKSSASVAPADNIEF